MKTSEVAKLLRKNGWTIKRHGSNHDIYSHPDFQKPIPLPRHPSKEIAKGTLQSILKAAGLK